MPKRAVASQSPIGPASPRGEFAISLDRASNIITVTGRGFWTVEIVEAHTREFEQVLLQAHRDGRSTRTLVDLREAFVQAPDVAALLHDQLTRMSHRIERAAFVVPSNLVKMQMKRGFNLDTDGVFTSIDEAVCWLAA
jgi:hypothetical protein